MTGRAVGRVLDVRKDGKDLAVTTGPVDIAELIRECDIKITRMPLDFGEAIPYTTPDLPGREVTLAQLPPEATAMPEVFIRTAGTGALPVPPGTQPVPPVKDVTNLINFDVMPVVSSSGLGMRIATDAGGLKVSAEALAHLAKPTLDVRLKITLTGGVEEASVTLLGAAGLTWKFDVGTDVGLKANVNKLLTPDTDFSIPVYGIGGLPFAVTVRQRFEIKTALGVRNSTLSATGDYVFHGGFMVEYAHGKWDANGPAGFSTKQSVMQSMNGIPIAASGLEVGHQLRVIVGVGQSGFAAGPYFSFSSARSTSSIRSTARAALRRARH